ncbi:MAG: hypothetical protein J6T01_02390 [Kiritimatiellae bacterium]|nr:hypothetical protein [Kiritimatiellia bacterium]
MNKLILSAAAFAVFSATAQPAPFTVDFAKEVGAVKKLNGVCNATPLANSRTRGINDLVLKLEVPYFRFHDAVLENPGLQLIDVRRIFQVFSADPTKAENYNFKPTDDYLKSVIDSGAEIEFRLGESIEHSPNVYLVNPPPDNEKWAEICCHIIRHYNEGWANGFKWNIRRWSIWEEPDTNPQLLTGAPNPFREVFLPLYEVASKRIKREFPHLLVGGPHTCGTWRLKEFLEFCSARKLPLDFCGYTIYTRDPETLARSAETARKQLDEHGYKDTKITIGEWHWGPVGWRGHGSVSSPRFSEAWSRELIGYNSAAFTAAALIRMQDTPIDYMHFYAMKCGSWGLFDGYRRPYPCYYSMLAFAQLLHGDVRVEAMTVPERSWYVLASKEKSTGRGRILVATIRTDNHPTLFLKGGVKPVSVKVIDPARDLEETSEWKWDAAKESLHLLRNVGDSTVWLIETEPAK